MFWDTYRDLPIDIIHEIDHNDQWHDHDVDPAHQPLLQSQFLRGQCHHLDGILDHILMDGLSLLEAVIVGLDLRFIVGHGELGRLGEVAGRGVQAKCKVGPTGPLYPGHNPSRQGLNRGILSPRLHLSTPGLRYFSGVDLELLSPRLLAVHRGGLTMVDDG